MSDIAFSYLVLTLTDASEDFSSCQLSQLRKRDEIKICGSFGYTKNDVIYEFQTEPFGTGLQFFSQMQIGLARRQIARWMVVRNDDSIRARPERRLEDLLRVNFRRSILMPYRNKNRLGKHLAVRIKGKNEDALLFLFLRQLRPNYRGGLRGGFDETCAVAIECCHDYLHLNQVRS